ncbi:MAG: hypothetical protein M1820_006049 [Bogoriella megaspora]|nr:MAG: hypothetical protein M1820_006049 [Bogoriella megaspora]
MLVVYAATFFGSTIIYRSFFHRLRSFSGPRLAHAALKGPNELTIFAPTALQVILDGRKNRMTKSVWYDFLLPLSGLNAIRDNKLHDQRRRIWDRAFTTNALQKYETHIIHYAQKLESQVRVRDGKPLEVTSWFHWYSFDLMGEFAFSRSFDMLEKGSWHHAIELLRDGMSLLGYLSPVPWLGQLAINLKFLRPIRKWNAMVDWCGHRMKERIEMPTAKNDVSYWLIEALQESKDKEKELNLLNGDAITMVIAGSDTVAQTLVYLFYRLALHKNEARKLYAELQSIEPPYDLKALRCLPHLNALINETLRLHPAVPTGGLRDTPPEGIVIDSRYIPGSVTVCVPQYTHFRLESCFERSNEFIPERWYSRPELVKDKTAFAPFSLGRSNCVGKHLALDEMRYVIALLVLKYDIGFAPGEDGTRVIADMKDNFTAVPGKLDLVFSLKEESHHDEAK